MDIRELTESELSDLLSLYQHLHSADDLLPEMDVVNKVWSKISSDKNLRYFGLFHADCLVSSCTLTIIPNLTRSCRPYGVIENVVTHVEYRKRGYGRAVLEYALDRAWESSCYKVMLLTGRMDEGTFRFYESAGFDRGKKQAFLATPGNIQ